MICSHLPSWLSLACGTAGSIILYLVGGIDVSLIWLFVFCLIDYSTGTIAALKNGQWSSNVGGKGICKKVVIFLMVIIAHGIDQAAGIQYVRQGIIIAYIINEAGSILENIELLGYGKMIPAVLRNGIKTISNKNALNMSENSPNSH